MCRRLPLCQDDLLVGHFHRSLERRRERGSRLEVVAMGAPGEAARPRVNDVGLDVVAHHDDHLLRVLVADEGVRLDRGAEGDVVRARG